MQNTSFTSLLERFWIYLYFEYILYSTKYSFAIYNKKRAAASRARRRKPVSRERVCS